MYTIIDIIIITFIGYALSLILCLTLSSFDIWPDKYDKIEYFVIWPIIPFLIFRDFINKYKFKTIKPMNFKILGKAWALCFFLL